ncbi:MAG: cyclic nucleotide-binding domain-containing protein [Bdellovibrionaceae bacterium]|nr:cyclic nucleotide-binding domain-containing protein [Pseudobdellovibrionaceae bacterium]
MEKFTEVKFKSGDLIFQEKQGSDALFIIKSGQVQIFRLGKDRESRIPLGIAGSGEYLGELSVLLGQPHSSNALALTDVVAVQLKKDVIDDQLKNSPPWLVGMVKGLVSKLQRTNEILRRNNLVDETLANTVTAIEDNHKRSQKAG